MLKRHLLAPGPTPVPPEVLGRMAMPIIHHRSPDFVPVLEDAKLGLKWLYQTENDVMLLSSSGTGGMVAAVNNFFAPGEKVLIVNGGKFGERWGEICSAYGIEYTEIIVEWGYAVNPDDVSAALKADPSITGVLMQASETSTGVYHDVQAVGQAIKGNEGVLFVVDAISSLVAHDMRPDEWGVDVMVAGSQKGFMIPPGLAFISVSQKAWAKDTKGSPRFYFNLKKERASLAKNQTAFSSSVTLILALQEAIKLLRAEGLVEVFARHARLAHATREAVKAIGLTLYAKESPSNALTAIEAPEGLDGQEIYKAMREDYGITGAGGQGKARGRIFRIAHLGYADTFDTITAISGLEMVLKGMGHNLQLGAGVARAEEILMKG